MAREREIPPYRKVLDLDWTAQSTQNFIGGGTFTVAGQSWETDNHGAADVFGITNGIGLVITNDATSTAWGRPTTATCPSFKLAGILGVLGAVEQVHAIIIRQHMDVSAANAATEFAGICIHDNQSTTWGLSAGLGHDGVRERLRAFKDTTTALSNISAAQKGVDAVVAAVFWPLTGVAYAGTAPGGVIPSFAAMTKELAMSGNGNPSTLFPGLDNQDFYIYSESGNVANNQSVIVKRTIIEFLEVRLP